MSAKARGKGNPLLAERHRQPSPEETVEPIAPKTRQTFGDSLDAIARGVEAWFEERTAYSRKVTETTVSIARALGIPADDIRRWQSSRSRHNSDQGRLIDSILEKRQISFYHTHKGSAMRNGGETNPELPGVNRCRMGAGEPRTTHL